MQFQYLTTAEVAKLLGLSRIRAWQLVSTGEIKGEKVGRMWLVLPIHLRDYMEKRAQEKIERKV